MKTEQRLRALFLLSYADLCAVGPNVWNDWKGALLLQLYLRTVKHLLGRAESVGKRYWITPKADRIRALVPGPLRVRVDEHLQGLGERYFTAFTPERIVTHLETVAEAEQNGLAIHIAENPETAMSEVVVCTRDRTGLFAQIAGSFAAHLIDVNSAALFTRDDGIVVDCFTVADARRRRPLTHRQAAAVQRVLRAVLFDGEDIQTFVDRSRKRLFALLQPRIPVRTRVSFDNDSSRDHTVIDVETGDRTGLLYDMARAITEAGLDISSARIVTDARRVRDSFYVTKNKGKIRNRSEQAGIRDGLCAAIHPRPAMETKGGSP